MVTKRTPRKQRSSRRIRRRWFIGAAGLVVVVLVLGGWLIRNGQASTPTEAPEAQRVLDAQADMPFQILIPAYLPRGFIREDMQLSVEHTGPGGEDMVQLTYRGRHGESLFIREWVPVNADREILAASRPIQTKWGPGWLLRQGEGLAAVWIDIGPLRASIYTPSQELVAKEDLLAIAETMGPASNRQVFGFVLEMPEIREVEPPPPLEIPINAEGVQEVDLIITPGGYSPLRFSVQKGVPVRLTFRQLGRVGCGNELNFPIAPDNYAALKLDDPSDKAVLEFTPETVGEFQFYCAHVMYKGLLTVRE